MASIRIHPPKLIVEVPSPFPYTDIKMVPWNYNYNYVNEPATTNISGIRGMTQNERCYASISTETVSLNLTKEPPNRKKLKVILDVINESIIEKKASKFLKFIKHSKYNMVEQLNKLLACIFLLALLMNSEPPLQGFDKGIK